MTVYIIILSICILLSAFFSAAEIAYTALPRHRLEVLCEEGNRRARVAMKIKDRFDRTLCSILVANDLVNVLTSSVATTLALTLALRGLIGEAEASVLSTLVTTVVVLIFGDIIPKLLAKQYSLGYALLIAYPLWAVMWVLYPVVQPVSRLVSRIKEKTGIEDAPTMTEEELSAMFETAEEEGVVDEEMSDLLQSAMDYQETTAEEILTPRINLEGLPLEAEPEEVLALCNATIHSRIPVYEGTLDRIVGILSVNKYLRAAMYRKEGAPEIKSLMKEPYFVHKSARLPAVLREMRRRRMHIAVVIDEYGGTMGIVTMEDILEQIVGDIWDESDDIVSDGIIPLDGTTYDVDGITPISDFFEEADIDDRGFHSAYTTMGGWAVEMLMENPTEGDVFTWRTLTVTVTEMKDNLVSRLRVAVTEPQEVEE
ncbi:MAG: HlyC/CorC family transporter [Clostridia bacterium]|nr:HlyC/CorC family transporter [Clostridia bacterium]